MCQMSDPRLDVAQGIGIMTQTLTTHSLNSDVLNGKKDIALLRIQI